mmetsp:Transcript_22895/g.17344  ORF Transcript_22895/g.17344 Transcript_22895/m.17344 type:complete len:95 (-) Transcript_22895:1779-2063(-)
MQDKFISTSWMFKSLRMGWKFSDDSILAFSMLFDFEKGSFSSSSISMAEQGNICPYCLDFWIASVSSIFLSEKSLEVSEPFEKSGVNSTFEDTT